ncbi:MAG TPA: hypothetical protein VF398_04450 [bacterium]
MIEKVCKRVNLKDKTSDFVFWQSQPPQARIDALEEIRREYHLWRYGAEPRFQRVCRIVKR